MGLTIFYSGQLKNVMQIPSLMNEVSDICDGFGWRCEFFEPTSNYPLSGVVFNAPGSEEIWLTFLQNGSLASPEYLIHNTTDSFFNKKEIVANSIVQFAGPDAHMKLIRILRYVSKKYFRVFRLTDESEFWETGNAEKCRDWYLMFDGWMKNMSEDLGKLDGRGYEDGSTFQDRLKDVFSKEITIEKFLKTMGDPFRRR